MYITFASAMRIRQPTLALKPRGGQRTEDMCMCPPKIFKKKKNFTRTGFFSESLPLNFLTVIRPF